LRLVSDAPVVVAGRDFQQRVLVRVSLQAGGSRLTKIARASAVGRFTARFGTTLGHACDRGPVVVVATTARGQRAVLKIPAPECPPTLGRSG
jgi:hypothetical protein